MTKDEFSDLRVAKHFLTSAMDYLESGRIENGVDLIRNTDKEIDRMIKKQEKKRGSL